MNINKSINRNVYTTSEKHIFCYQCVTCQVCKYTKTKFKRTYLRLKTYDKIKLVKIKHKLQMSVYLTALCHEREFVAKLCSRITKRLNLAAI